MDLNRIQGERWGWAAYGRSSTFLALDFRCPLLLMVHPIIARVSGWIGWFQPMWGPRGMSYAQLVCTCSRCSPSKGGSSLQGLILIMLLWGFYIDLDQLKMQQHQRGIIPYVTTRLVVCGIWITGSYSCRYNVTCVIFSFIFFAATSQFTLVATFAFLSFFSSFAFGHKWTMGKTLLYNSNQHCDIWQCILSCIVDTHNQYKENGLTFMSMHWRFFSFSFFAKHLEWVLLDPLRRCVRLCSIDDITYIWMSHGTKL